MKKRNLILRLGLFALIVGLGSLVALVTGESAGLALSDLSNASVGAMTEMAGNEALFAALNDEAPRKGVYRSEDKGRSWMKISSGPGQEISALAIHPANERILYAGSPGGEIFGGESLWISDDAGRSWSPYQLTLPTDVDHQLPQINILAVDPNHPGVLYAGTDGQGLYRVQLGQTGYELMGGPAMRNLFVKGIVTGVDGVLYTITTNGLFEIKGDIWREISVPDLAVSLAVDPANPQTLYAGTVASGAYRSSDGGETWQPINTALGKQPGVILRVSAIAVDSQDSLHLTLATSYGVGSQLSGGAVYESFDAGRSWIMLGEGNKVVKRLTIRDGGIYAATDAGLLRYGEPLPTASLAARLRLDSLANPNGVQILALILTLALAGWVLLGRMNWLLEREVNRL